MNIEQTSENISMCTSKFKMVPKINKKWKYTLRDVLKALSNIYDVVFCKDS